MLIRPSFTALALAGAAASVAAETTTVSVFLPISNDKSLVGSIVGVDDKFTTIAIGCPPDAGDDDCGFNPSQTVMQGKSSWVLHYPNVGFSSDSTETGTLDCKLDHTKDVAECTVSDVYVARSTTSATTIVQSTPLSANILPIAITAGAEKLSAAATATTTTASITGTTATESETSTSTDDDSPAGPKATQNVVLVGAAALVGGVMALY